MMKPALTARKQAGFTLIEVLVTLVILAVGLLGLSAMQLTSLKVNQGAYNRSQASILATDMLDRIRANPTAVAAYDDLDTAQETIPSNNACAEGCSPAEIASQDFREWSANFIDVYELGDNFLALVPGGQGTIEHTAATNTVKVTVSWQQERWQEDDGERVKELVTEQFELETQL